MFYKMIYNTRGLEDKAQISTDKLFKHIWLKLTDNEGITLFKTPTVVFRWKSYYEDIPRIAYLDLDWNGIGSLEGLREKLNLKELETVPDYFNMAIILDNDNTDEVLIQIHSKRPKIIDHDPVTNKTRAGRNYEWYTFENVTDKVTLVPF